MSYLHIDNLYKDQSILEFKHVYALEKIHGTSAHIHFLGGVVTFFSGGEKHERFSDLFDYTALYAKFVEKFGIDGPVTVYGEAYGGKQQGMSKTYGPNLKFVAFDVKVGDAWLSVPKAEAVVKDLGLEFVDYRLIQTTVEAINAERDRPSSQALRNAVERKDWDITPKREGVVLRPPFEVTLNNGRRLIAKHKSETFSERASKADTTLDPAANAKLEQAEAIAYEWVTVTRLEHVVDKLKAEFQRDPEIQWVPSVITRMYDDILRESAGEVVNLPAAKKQISNRTVMLFKEYLQRGLVNVA